MAEFFVLTSIKRLRPKASNQTVLRFAFTGNQSFAANRISKELEHKRGCEPAAVHESSPKPILIHIKVSHAAGVRLGEDQHFE
jgi:hypothetical protein